MFATTFYLEREPLALAELPAAFWSWVQSAGAIAAIALLLWGIAGYFGPKQQVSRSGPTRFLVILCAVFSGLLYLGLGIIYLGSLLGAAALVRYLPASEAGDKPTIGSYLLLGAGGLALWAVLLPILGAILTRLRWIRIWALARVSLKDAIRKRVVMVFAVMTLIFLFAEWFIGSKAEDQLRTYVSVVYISMSILFLLTASLLGAFSIPNDVKNQSIHTIVTKPVEKFEIVLGRFLGYGILLTVGLAVVAGLSLIYVLRGVNPDAAEESLKARVPVYGELRFERTSKPQGDSVGREWDYRRYISGPQPSNLNAPAQYAIWYFDEVPAYLGERDDPVPFEFTFDIFRLNKGEEGKGIYCTFTFAATRVDWRKIEQTLKQIQAERTERQAEAIKRIANPQERQDAFAKINDDLIAKYGVVEVFGVEVSDYHTQALKVPAAFFKKLNDIERQNPRPAVRKEERWPAMTVMVNVDSRSAQQMLGVARRDFYLLADDRSFEMNFLKGIMGMWCTFMLVLGLAIACSTYLSGVISWLCTIFLFGAGLFTDYIHQLAQGRAAGGGPIESAYRLMTHAPLAAPIEGGPTSSLILGTDNVYRWWLRQFLNVIPDVNRYDLHHYVANGFDISWSQILLVDNLLPLAGYLLPWAILAFYLMKFREIANPT